MPIIQISRTATIDGNAAAVTIAVDPAALGHYRNALATRERCSGVAQR
jgi:hypothetical protein